jgi:hypothetical protein
MTFSASIIIGLFTQALPNSAILSSDALHYFSQYRFAILVANYSPKVPLVYRRIYLLVKILLQMKKADSGLCTYLHFYLDELFFAITDALSIAFLISLSHHVYARNKNWYN